MQIHVTFDNTQEMEQFCRLIAGTKDAVTGAKTEAPAPQLAPAIAASAPTPQAAPATVQPAAAAAPAQAPVAPAPQPTRPPVQPTAPSAPVQPATVPAGSASVPTTAPGYTLDDLSRAAITLLDAGHQQAELQQLLAKFGVAALPMLPESQYGAFATALRGLGAKI